MCHSCFRHTNYDHNEICFAAATGFVLLTPGFQLKVGRVGRDHRGHPAQLPAMKEHPSKYYTVHQTSQFQFTLKQTL